MSLAQVPPGPWRDGDRPAADGCRPELPGLQQASAVWALRDAQRRASAAGGLPLEFPSGSTAFVEAMVRALSAPPLLGAK